MHVFQRAPRQRFGHGWKEGRRHALAFEMLGQVELELGGSLGHAVGELAAFVPFVRHLRSEMRMHAPVVCAQVGAEPMDARTVVCRAQLAQPGEDRRLRRDRAESLAQPLAKRVQIAQRHRPPDARPVAAVDAVQQVAAARGR